MLQLRSAFMAKGKEQSVKGKVKNDYILPEDSFFIDSRVFSSDS
jgi:hypothetical protein